jgi:cyclopropane fatty-acyl-phospholipid synthase-like methyltransferase
MKVFSNVVIIVVAVFVGVLYHLGQFDYGVDKPGLLGLLNKHTHEVIDTVTDYTQRQGYNAEEENRDVGMVDSYYTLATDFYEYGWGESFHFAHRREGESHDASIKRHEQRLVDIMQIKAGDSVVDVGCGVGGPAREIARYSQAKITGVTINEYQVARANNLTAAAGLSDLIEYKQQDFTKMELPANSFDFAYAIEATCHAPQLVDVYRNVFNVLKDDGLFATYEWISTPEYDADNEEHQKIMREIEYGNGLPPVRSLAQALEAGRAAGFELVSEVDLAQDTDKTIPWFKQLDMIMTWKAHLTHYFCMFMEAVGLSPKGTTTTHDVMLHAGKGLLDGGMTNVFTPMHLIVFRKPAAAAEEVGAAAN